jgi:hypothetical protein
MKEPWFEMHGFDSGANPAPFPIRVPGRILRQVRASRHDRRCAWRVAATIHQQPKESTVAKGMEQKKETKKKPAKTMKEKKAEKNAKKASK